MPKISKTVISTENPIWELLTYKRRMSVKFGREKDGKETSMDMAEYLEEEEVQKLIESAPTIQKKAFLACMYESGARPEEFLRLTNYDIRIDSNGAVLMLRGNTGERRVRIISFTKLLQQWMEIHPLRNQQNFYSLWISEATNFKNNALGIRGAQKIIEEALPKWGYNTLVYVVHFGCVIRFNQEFVSPII